MIFASGFYIVECGENEALEIAARMPVVTHGVVEVRPSWTFPAQTPLPDSQRQHSTWRRDRIIAKEHAEVDSGCCGRLGRPTPPGHRGDPGYISSCERRVDRPGGLIGELHADLKRRLTVAIASERAMLHGVPRRAIDGGLLVHGERVAAASAKGIYP